ncbi:BON domain-containing protein [Bdellovibrio sp. 22V]|uniref:BON domain-containing protein n=1 Tax=Bdellovibrio TaxID=958 RepID=UPI002542B40F|nr:BON domain-containing protein [Bdellovibrio sp. 22V]WII72422.1 BON domain-containing protein [Bdellovibrio sp. 22V]
MKKQVMTILILSSLTGYGYAAQNTGSQSGSATNNNTTSDSGAMGSPTTSGTSRTPSSTGSSSDYRSSTPSMGSPTASGTDQTPRAEDTSPSDYRSRTPSTGSPTAAGTGETPTTTGSGSDRSMSAGRTGTSSDTDLAASARRALQEDTALSQEARSVRVDVRNGRATLQGTVSSPEERQQIRSKVMATEGIRSVDDKLTVKE